MDFLSLYEKCQLCPRGCGVNRLKEGESAYSGFCGETQQLRVAYVGPHFGEEPPITGQNGSGTIFFAGCSLRCCYCQNYQISRDGLGKPVDVDTLYRAVMEMIEKDKVHNINLVTPDHFFPHAFQLVSLIRRSGFNLPVVCNLSGYQSLALLEIAEQFTDIYLPDFKYADPALSTRLSKCKDYPTLALEAIVEMVRQKGFLHVPDNGPELAEKGVLVRHLILPGQMENSLNALTTLFLEFGGRLPLSLMSQYTPALPQRHGELNRSITREEFDRVYSHALDLGFEHLYVQFPDQNPPDPPHDSAFLPDFRREQPFSKQRVDS
jgi:putative pyruvate formate lyase activating enzyme